MTIESHLHTLDSTLQSFAEQVKYFAGVALQAVVYLRTEIDTFFTPGDWQWQSPVQFTDLQSLLLKVFVVLLLVTGALIAWSWSVYGEVITEKFIKPSTLKETEELKLSVAKLKLPKEHSPRI